MSSRRKSRSRHRATADPLALAVGRRVRDLRREQDYSYDAFVEETGLGRGYISELERGLVVPSLATLARLAAAFEMSVPELLAFGDATIETLIETSRKLTDVQKRRLLREAIRIAERSK